MFSPDPIADLCTRIRNAKMRNYPSVKIPYSKIKERVIDVLYKEGFIEKWEFQEEKPQSWIIVSLKYTTAGESVIRTIERVSKPGRRVHLKVTEIKPVLRGQGIAIVTTSKGVLSDKECREQKTGGEILCQIW